MKHKKKIIIGVVCGTVLLVIVLANIFGHGWIFYMDGPYRGEVIDYDTGKPIDGTAVVGIWNIQVGFPPVGLLALSAMPKNL